MTPFFAVPSTVTVCGRAYTQNVGKTPEFKPVGNISYMVNFCRTTLLTICICSLQCTTLCLRYRICIHIHIAFMIQNKGPLRGIRLRDFEFLNLVGNFCRKREMWQNLVTFVFNQMRISLPLNSTELFVTRWECKYWRGCVYPKASSGHSQGKSTNESIPILLRTALDWTACTGWPVTLIPIFCCDPFGDFPWLVGRYCS